MPALIVERLMENEIMSIKEKQKEEPVNHKVEDLMDDWNDFRWEIHKSFSRLPDQSRAPSIGVQEQVIVTMLLASEVRDLTIELEKLRNDIREGVLTY